MCSVEGAERPDFSLLFARKARKTHVCEECWRQIAVSEIYQLAKGLYGNNWSEYKTCTHCAALQRWLGTNCGGWIYSGAVAEIHEHASEYPILAFGLLRMVVGAKRKWRRFDNLGLLPVPAMARSIDSIVASPKMEDTP